MGAREREELRKQEVAWWVSIGWRSGVTHSRARGLRRQGTLIQIFPAPYCFFFFFAGLPCCPVVDINCISRTEICVYSGFKNQPKEAGSW